MIGAATQVEAISALEHDEAMRLADGEYDRLLAVVDELSDDDWARPTDCAGWSVRDMLGHILGSLELQADADERARQLGIAGAEAAATGCLRLDAMTALQVREHAHLTTTALRAALHEAAPRGLAARRAIPAEMLAAPYESQLPGEGTWTVGYLFDIVLTRDPWLHRVDICRAIERELSLSAEHDGRIVANVVADWAERVQHPFTLVLGGPAGGTYVSGSGGDELQHDAVEFCRILSGRAPGEGLLATRVVF